MFQVTRRYLVRVCKKWHRLAFLYLYEWVMATKLKNLAGMVQILEQQLFGDPHAYVGWCTKRLDIDFRWSGEETLEELYDQGLLVLRLLRAVPNLQILTSGNCFSHLWITPRFSHTYCPKLEFFSWMGELSVFGLEDWAHFVQSHPNLIGMNAYAIGSPSDITTQIPSLPHGLSELTIGIACPVSINATFTSLSRLTLSLYTLHVSPANPDWHQHLITSPLPSLTSLQLNLTNHTTNHHSELESVVPLFQFLPNLRRIDLALLEWPQFWGGCIFPSSVSTLGLRVRSAKPKKQAIKRMLCELSQVVRDAMSPLRVQLLDEQTMQVVCMYKAYLVRNAVVGKMLLSWLDPDGNVYRLHV